jgi:hypothetical protein
MDRCVALGVNFCVHTSITFMYFDSEEVTAFTLPLPWRHIFQGVPLHYTLLEYLSLHDVCLSRCGVECGSSRRSTRCKKEGVQVLGHEMWWTTSCMPLTCRWMDSPQCAVATDMTKKTQNDLLSSSSSKYHYHLPASPPSGLWFKNRPLLWNLWWLIMGYLMTLFQFHSLHSVSWFGKTNSDVGFVRILNESVVACFWDTNMIFSWRDLENPR